MITDNTKEYSEVIQDQNTDKTSEKITRKEAIKLKCLNCVNNERAISRIKNCLNKDCSLWCWRPYKPSDQKIKKQKPKANHLEHLQKARDVLKNKKAIIGSK